MIVRNKIKHGAPGSRPFLSQLKSQGCPTLPRSLRKGGSFETRIERGRDAGRDLSALKHPCESVADFLVSRTTVPTTSATATRATSASTTSATTTPPPAAAATNPAPIRTISHRTSPSSHPSDRIAIEVRLIVRQIPAAFNG